MPDTEAPVLVEVDGAVATITLNRPERLNTFVPELGRLMIEALERLGSDGSVRVVVLTGAGTGFSAGGDLTDGLASLLGDGSDAEREAALREHVRVVELLRSLPQVTLAAVDGACAGAGLSFALACDLRVASDRAKFAAAFLAAGVSGDFGGIWFATRLLGAARARELFLLGDRIDAAEALRLGLVSRVLPADTFSDDVAALVARLAGSAPLALAELTANLRDAEVLDLPAYLDVETARQVRTMSSEDAAEAAAAFFAKRTPTFHGR